MGERHQNMLQNFLIDYKDMTSEDKSRLCFFF